MSLQSNLTISGSIRKRTISSSGTIVEWPRIPLLFKMVIGILFCLILLTLGSLMVSRAGAIPQIPDPPELYIPGRAVPQLPEDAVCREPQFYFHTCVFNLLGQRTYLTFDPKTKMIVQIAIQVREYKIGNLITAWGNPTGIKRYFNRVQVSWGRRSAVLYTYSFRPESLIEFIQYDLEEHQAPPWQGFVNRRSVDTSVRRYVRATQVGFIRDSSIPQNEVIGL